MADEVKVVLGHRSDADVALDLAKWIGAYHPSEIQSADNTLALYVKCFQTIRERGIIK